MGSENKQNHRSRFARENVCMSGERLEEDASTADRSSGAEGVGGYFFSASDSVLKMNLAISGYQTACSSCRKFQNYEQHASIDAPLIFSFGDGRKWKTTQ